MGRLPVFRTIGTAYRFVFSQFPTILRLTWFPFLVIAVLSYASAAVGPTHLDAGAVLHSPALLGLSFAAIVIQAGVSSMVAVAIHRLILFNDRRPGAIILFSFGRAELLFIATWALFFVVILIGGLLTFVASTLFRTAAPPPWIVAATFIGLFVLVLIAVYASVRVMTIYPIIVVENSLNFRESWRLGRGKFWRQFWIIALGLLPVAIIAVAIQAIVTFNALEYRTSVSAFEESARQVLPFTVAWQFVFGIVASALSVALICFSYKSLRGLPPDALVSGPSSAPGTNATAAPQA